MTQPLNPRSVAPAGESTLFTRIAGDRSGLTVVNRYDDPRMWGDRFQEHAFGSIATGVAAGDYDGDGLPDLFIVQRMGPPKLYHNLGGLKFEDLSEKAGILPDADEWASGAAFVDFDGDGRLDIWLGRHGAPNRVYLNRGDGTFVESAARLGLDQRTSSVMASFADYDNDGDLDCYLVTNRLDARVRPGEPDVLLRNEGGHFNDVSREAGIGGGYQTFAAAWADFDRDGRPDIYVANDFTGPDFLYHNEGTGKFRNVLDEQVPLTSFYSMGADIGDLNRDGWFDIVVADMLPTDHRQFLKNTAELVNLQAAEDTNSVPQTMRNVVLLNTGTGHFLEIAWFAGLAATDWTWSVLLADYDNDGWEDAFFTNGMFRDFMDSDAILKIDRRQGASPAAIWRTMPEMHQRNLAFRNRGDLKFENVSAPWGLDEDGISFGAVSVDLDRDGDLDLVVSNYNGAVSLYRNDSSERHRMLVQLRSAKPNRFGIGATIRVRSDSGWQARLMTVARGIVSGHEPVVHFGLGADSVVHELTVEWPDGAVQKFNGLRTGAMLTITEPADATAFAGPPAASPQYRETSVTHGLSVKDRRPDTTHAEAALQPLVPERFDGVGPGVAAADVNGDGLSDLYIGAAAGQRGTLLLAGADGNFSPAATPPLVDEAAHQMAPIFLDADGDGDLDLFVVAGGVVAGQSTARRDQLLLNDGHGNFTGAPDAPAFYCATSSAVAASADFDRDGDLDLFVGGRVSPGGFPEAPLSRLLENRGGHWLDVTADVAPELARAGMITSALWTDYDGDGWQDLLLATSWGPLQLFHNMPAPTGGPISRRLAPVTETGFEALSGWWSSLAAADFNGDGRIDYFAGNTGLNTRYSASTQHPALLIAADWAKEGHKTPIEARFDGEVLRPWHGITETLRAVRSRPFAAAMLRRFPTFAAYSNASLEEIFTPGALSGADIFAATDLRSGVWLNDGGGHFHFQSLPDAAQLFPIRAAVAGDFDGDGFADLVVAGNSYAPEPSAGRFVGGLGLLLRGDGSGGFLPLTPRESGFVVPGAAASLVALDVNRDGRAEFFVTREKETSLYFEPATPAQTEGSSRWPFSVKLRGRPGNAGAVGALVQLRHRDGRWQIGEICAGGGLGQSEPLLFFGAPVSNPIVRIDVRWPDGEVTNPDWTPGRTVIVER